MNNIKRTLILTLFFTFLLKTVNGQDTTNTIKSSLDYNTHEIGFNTVLLIKQLISNNPSSTLSQSPYMVLYNYYFSKENSIRSGLGGIYQTFESNIEGQTLPRTTSFNQIDLRLGYARHLVNNKHIAINFFADGIYSQMNSLSSTTTTLSVFPNPVSTQVVESSQNGQLYGAQIGAGLKYNFYKYLSLYIELPISYVMAVTKTTDSVKLNGVERTPTTNSIGKNNEAQIGLPTTIYLILKF